MSKTYAIVEVIEGEQIQLVRRWCIAVFKIVYCRLWLGLSESVGTPCSQCEPQLDRCSGISKSQPRVSDYKMSRRRGVGRFLNVSLCERLDGCEWTTIVGTIWFNMEHRVGVGRSVGVWIWEGPHHRRLRHIIWSSDSLLHRCVSDWMFSEVDWFNQDVFTSISVCMCIPTTHW